MRNRYPALQLLNHMKFCGPNMVTFLQFLMAQPNILTPICKQKNQSTDSKKMVELELQPRAPYVRFSSAAQLTHQVGWGQAQVREGDVVLNLAWLKQREGREWIPLPQSELSPLPPPGPMPSPGVCSDKSGNTIDRTWELQQGESLASGLKIERRAMAPSFGGGLGTSRRQMCFLQGCRGPVCSWNANPEQGWGGWASFPGRKTGMSVRFRRPAGNGWGCGWLLYTSLRPYLVGTWMGRGEQWEILEVYLLVG